MHSRIWLAVNIDYDIKKQRHKIKNYPIKYHTPAKFWRKTKGEIIRCVFMDSLSAKFSKIWKFRWDIFSNVKNCDSFPWNLLRLKSFLLLVWYNKLYDYWILPRFLESVFAELIKYLEEDCQRKKFFESCVPETWRRKNMSRNMNIRKVYKN